jgi:hypothetical protein
MRYRFDKLAFVAGERRSATWTFAGTKVAGHEYPYAVTDRNHVSRNRWEFVVRVPHAAAGRIEVRPVQVPNDDAWAGLDRYGLTFMPATRPGYTRDRYCLLSFPRTDGGGTRSVMHQGEESKLPYWLRHLGRRLCRKDKVRSTRGTDAHALVILVPRDDYERMIALYLATKAWVLKSRAAGRR